MGTFAVGEEWWCQEVENLHKGGGLRGRRTWGAPGGTLGVSAAFPGAAPHSDGR